MANGRRGGGGEGMFGMMLGSLGLGLVVVIVVAAAGHLCTYSR